MTARVLVQLDSDPHPSLFDSMVAIDAGVERLLTYGGIAAADVRGLVHGAMFTRGPEQLHHTAIFIGGSDVALGERLFDEVRQSFLGTMRVSVLLDANGANTTAAAAVLAASRHVRLEGARAAVVGGTGPVGRRAARLLAHQGADVTVVSRQADRAAEVCGEIRSKFASDSVAGEGDVRPSAMSDLDAVVRDARVVIAAGAAGARLVSEATWRRSPALRVLIDLNAVPPAGVEGIERLDRGTLRDPVVCYGAIGVGGTKMKIHRAAVRRLFERNDLVLDAEEVLSIAQSLDL
ncbi:MAG: SDR family NAD(P)-dependent oxidoreductase [Planctomycetes bacterium]|nr:SDR family NAD(P)-dependent oxidoreductase [Planctomycetota bacterium]